MTDNLFIDINDKFKIRITSPKRLYVKGPPKLATIKINQKILNNLLLFNNPELKKNLREWLRSYIIFAPANIPEEHTPCANIIIITPSSPHLVSLKTPAITRAIWTTEEYAITTFISLCTTQRILKTPPPINLNENNWHISILILVILIRRKIPYPPNFNKTPAKIIEPETGASTCALGNHKCTTYIGNFTRNANTLINHKNFGVSALKIILILMVSLQLTFNKIEISKGSDAKRV